ncbi:P-loop containing nucleoside triphosphate hydrolase protein [Pelagophyceae sp. CCMP2097]|nr:P-loop containing nucleoside triphosphate hydrolase protein [Pelagophyceae sp. CCMP2097]
MSASGVSRLGRGLCVACVVLSVACDKQWTYRLGGSDRYRVTPVEELGLDGFDPVPDSRQRCFRNSGPRRNVIQHCVPAFLIIGFGRCGTTSLAKYLSAHPQVSFGTRKEQFYFYRRETCDLQHGPNNSTQCLLSSYARRFPVLRAAPRKRVFFDATPMLGGDMGMAASERTMAWIRSRLPHVRLLVLVKSPADRFMSNPLTANKLTRLQDSVLGGAGVMPGKLTELLSDNCYIDRLGPWLRHFPPGRFLLIKSEDLRGPIEDRQRILDDVHAFLGVDAHAYKAKDLSILGNYHTRNTSVQPVVRSLVNCLPEMRKCEVRR